MGSREILLGIVDLHASCSPDVRGYVKLEKVKSKLEEKASGIKVDDLLKLVPHKEESEFCFIQFWALIEQMVSVSDDSTVDDDLRSLRALRDKILRETRLGTTGPCIPHRRLMTILADIREKSTNKDVWNDLMLSAAADGKSPIPSHKLHSLDTLSLAIKVMLEEYLEDVSDLSLVPPVLPFPGTSVPLGSLRSSATPIIKNEREEQMQNEIDALKSRLTESECQLSGSVEETKRLGVLLQKALVKDDRQIEMAKKEFEATVTALQSAVARKDEELVMVRNELTTAKDQLGSVRERLVVVQAQLDEYGKNLVPTGGGADYVPSALEWTRLQAKLRVLMGLVGDKSAADLLTTSFASIESLSSQVQTLEVLKNDADAEITRLRQRLAEVERTEQRDHLEKSPDPSLSRSSFLPKSTTTTVNVHKSQPSVLGNSNKQLGGVMTMIDKKKSLRDSPPVEFYAIDSPPPKPPSEKAVSFMHGETVGRSKQKRDKGLPDKARLPEANWLNQFLNW